MSFEREFEHADQLFAVATREFAEHGYDQASINRILNGAGMSKGQFYHHFDSKQALYLALIGQVLEIKREHFDNAPVADQSDFFTTIETQLRAGLAFSRSQPDVHRFAASVLRERGRPIFHTVLERFAFDEDSALAQVVRRFHARGAFDRALSATFVERTVVTFFNQLISLVDLSDPDELDANLDQLLRFLRRGLARRVSDCDP